MNVVRVVDEAGFHGLKEAWNELAAVSGSVFLRHEWFDAAWQWRRDDAKLAILCVLAADKVVGIVPLLAPRRTRHAGRLVKFLDVPDTQLCDMLVDPGATTAACRAVAEHLRSDSSRWDALQLDRLPPGSIVEAALWPALEACGMRARLSVTDHNLFIDLGGGWNAYYDARSRRLRKSCNLAANRLARASDLTLDRLGPGELATARAHGALDEMVAISARSWKVATGITLDQPGPGAFIRKLTELALAQGWLSLWLLRSGERAIAMEYQVVHGGDVHALRADFDESVRSLSPGTYLNYRLIHDLFASGSKRYYMGPGRNAYKERWSDCGEPMHQLTCCAPTITGSLWRRWAGLKAQLRKWRASTYPPTPTPGRRG